LGRRGCGKGKQGEETELHVASFGYLEIMTRDEGTRAGSFPSLEALSIQVSEFRVMVLGEDVPNDQLVFHSRVGEMFPLLYLLIQAVGEPGRPVKPPSYLLRNLGSAYLKPPASQIAQPDRLIGPPFARLVEARMRRDFAFGADPEIRFRIFVVRLQQITRVV